MPPTKKCPECEHESSILNATCPKCGAQLEGTGSDARSLLAEEYLRAERELKQKRLDSDNKEREREDFRSNGTRTVEGHTPGGRFKNCPYCGETIKLDAKKCRYCGEWLNKEPSAAQTSSTGPQDNKASKENLLFAKILIGAGLLGVVVLLIVFITGNNNGMQTQQTIRQMEARSEELFKSCVQSCLLGNHPLFFSRSSRSSRSLFDDPFDRGPSGVQRRACENRCAEEKLNRKVEIEKLRKIR